MPEITACYGIETKSHEGHHVLSLHCLVNGGLSVDQAHDIASELELSLRRRLPTISQVVIHTEPADQVHDQAAQGGRFQEGE
jgi:divalent metal cation (Fe/Co/Zn/Cd) transporter